ncbi:kelch repeat and BTB domain-containing protein 2-like [Gigantopelta aegis]|uniref:kelch repeat and BTB domain-containing protein 2-like n=1 Tax=Gigantopelta aegis TaxID=1735272 RepID=UPI001B888E69|nr:kelch repeat and BTB domain-containing protein 2-like [Gigantopelta aegis]
MGMDYKECLTNGLVAALDCGRHADIAIEIEDKTFHCHKIVLEAMSPYFRLMFSDGAPNMSHGCLKIIELTKKGFEGALSYIYSGKSDLNQTDIYEILQASFFLQIEGLRELCEEMLVKTVLSTDTCIHLWQVAESCDCQQLLMAAKKMALESFDEVANKTKVSEFSAEQLVELFDDDNLKVASEVTVLTVAVQWAQEFEVNFSDCCNVFSAVHLDVICDEEWKTTMETHGKSISEALRVYLESLWAQSKMKSPVERDGSIRYFDRKEKVLVFISDIGSTFCYVLTTSYNPHAESIRFSPITPWYEDICCAKCCVHHGELYVECIIDGIATFTKMCSQTGQWVQCTARESDDVLSSTVLLSCNNCIYAVQGSKPVYTNNALLKGAKIQKYTSEENSWTTVCTLPDSVEDPLAVAASCFLCIYSRSDHHTTVYTYSYKSNVLKEVGELPEYVPKPDFAIASGRSRFLFCQREVTRVRNVLDEPYTLDLFDELGRYTRKNFRFNGVAESGKTIYCISSEDDEHYVLWEFNPDKLCLRKPRAIYSVHKWSLGGVVEIKRRFLT